jgi:hypothetical protein
MKNTFELKKGSLVFEDDKITISDNASYQKRMRLISSGLLVVMGGYNLTKYFETGRTEILFTGSLLLITGLILVISALRMNVQSEILLTDVKSLKVKRVLFKEFLHIKLTSNRTRQVAEIFNADRLREFIETVALPNKIE